MRPPIEAPASARSVAGEIAASTWVMSSVTTKAFRWIGVDRVREVHDHRVVAVRAQGLEEVLAIEERVELVPVHRVVVVEPLEDDDRIGERRVAGGEVDIGVAGAVAAAVGNGRGDVQRVVRGGRHERRDVEVEGRMERAIRTRCTEPDELPSRRGVANSALGAEGHRYIAEPVGEVDLDRRRRRRIVGQVGRGAEREGHCGALVDGLPERRRSEDPLSDERIAAAAPEREPPVARDERAGCERVAADPLVAEVHDRDRHAAARERRPGARLDRGEGRPARRGERCPRHLVRHLLPGGEGRRRRVLSAVVLCDAREGERAIVEDAGRDARGGDVGEEAGELICGAPGRGRGPGHHEGGDEEREDQMDRSPAA